MHVRLPAVARDARVERGKPHDFLDGKGHVRSRVLEAGASTELCDQNSDTALEVAEKRGHAAIAELLRQHAARPPATAAAPTPNLSGRRVRIDGLQARPELNGRCGVAGRFNAAKGRYEVAVEGEAEAVLLKPASLADFGLARAAKRQESAALSASVASVSGVKGSAAFLDPI